MSLIAELNRRNVFRATIAYVVTGWLLVEVGDVVLGTFGAPDWVLKSVIALLLLGLPGVVFFAWAFEVTPDGLKREHEVERDQSITRLTARRLDWSIIVLLVVALAFFAVDRFVFVPKRDAALVEATSPAVPDAVSEATSESPGGRGAAAGQPDKSIAVLPFADMSPEADQAYFSDGLSEELLNLLAKIPDLRVAARTSSFSFKDQNLEIPQIAERLNVAHVLEGSVRKAGNQVRITAQLVQGMDGYHLWSETYDRTLDNIFDIQDEIAAAVVDELRVKLLGTTAVAAETDPEAYALYLQARQLGRQNSEESLERSNALYQRVLELDPNYAAAWDGLATNYVQQASVGLRPAQEGFGLAREAANKALEIDPEFAGAHANLGQIAAAGRRDLAAAARHVQRALELEPGNIEILRTAASLYRVLGRLEKAIEVCNYTVKLDPVNNNAHYTLGLMHRYAGNLDEAMKAFQAALGLSPDRVGVHTLIAESLMLRGEGEAALEAIQQEESVWRMIGLPMIYHALGREADSDAALAELIDTHSQEAAYNIAYIVAFRGETDRAFEWLERAIEYDDPGLGDLPIESLFENIHDDPRWLPLLERLGMSPAQLDAIKFKVNLPE